MRILNIGMFNATEGQESMRIALEGISTYYEEYSYTQHPREAAEAYATAPGKFDVIFLHIQVQGIIDVRRTKRNASCGIKIFNFTGDVRQPIPKWYHELAPFVTTLFTNLHDVKVFNQLGFSSEYFQVGYNEHYYNKDVTPYRAAPEIVFMGNNYNNTFPLGPLRKEMVHRLQKKYGDKFGVYGCGWGKVENLNSNQVKEGRIYRGCKIAINLSHFDLERYSSDRLFRILGCNTFCLSHNYKEIEKEFINGEDLVTWNTLDELESLIDKYIKLDEERKRIANNGNIKCTTEFTWTARMNQLKELCRVHA